MHLILCREKTSGKKGNPCKVVQKMSDDFEAIVLDNGSGSMKVGFSGEDTPRAVFPTCTGKVKNPEWFNSPNSNVAALKANLRDRDTFVGSECQVYREFLEIVHPINRGVVECGSLCLPTSSASTRKPPHCR